jgi:hypothetical protein
MVASLARLLEVAWSEWQAWGSPTWNLGTGEKVPGLTDNDPERAQYIFDAYCVPLRQRPTLAEISDDDYYWSAVGMSYLFREADFAADEFPFSKRHSTWITKFISARRNGQAAIYHGYRLQTQGISPDVGDLVGYARGGISFEQAQRYFDRTGRYESHSDLVVERRAGEIDVIGANVMDSVALKTVPLDGNGFIADREFNWFVVMKRQF